LQSFFELFSLKLATY